MSDRNKGLYHKYEINSCKRVSAVTDAIVLEFKDPNSWPALEAWVKTLKEQGYDRLAKDVSIKLTRFRKSHRPIRCELFCPSCGHQHVDGNEWQHRHHKTHKCSACSHQWKPFDRHSFGVVIDDSTAPE